jgi:hypothetical protein
VPITGNSLRSAIGILQRNATDASEEAAIRLPKRLRLASSWGCPQTEFVGQCKKSLMSWQSTTKSSTRGSSTWKPGLAMFRLDYFSCLLTVLATILVGRKSWTGLLISIVNSLVVCIIGVRTSQFGLIPANLFCVCVYAFSIRSWLRAQRERNQAPSPVAVRSRITIDRSRTRVAHALSHIRTTEELAISK